MVFRGCGLSLLALIMLVIVEILAPSAAGSMMYNKLVAGGDSNFGSGAAAEALTVNLMHHDHVNSPYAKQNITLEERVQVAVKRSHERAQFFQDQIYGSSGSGEVDSSTPLYWSNNGGYIMQISVGTPARTFMTVADTGSSLVWIKCSPCRTCSQNDTVFDPASSTSYATVPCTNQVCSALPVNGSCSSTNTCLYDDRYGEVQRSITNTSGDLVSETLTLVTTTGTNQTFSNFTLGCSHESSSAFAYVDGIVGLGNGSPSLVTQLGSHISNVFSYCLVPFESARNKTSPLLLGSDGGGDGTLVYTPLLTNHGSPKSPLYYVNLVGITVGGAPVSYPSETFSITSSGQGGFILDSGTTLTLLDNRAYTPFRQAVSSRIDYQPMAHLPNSSLDLCYNFSGVTNPQVPTVVFQFENLNLTLPYENIFFSVRKNGIYCLAFMAIDPEKGRSIFGNIAQQNFQIAYDIANKRVGFLSRTC